MHIVKHMLRYIQGTLDHGLQLHVSPTTNLVAYSYTDCGICTVSCRLTSGYYVFLGDNLISWFSKPKQKCVISRSSAKSEYHGVANVIAETCWVHNLLRELRCPLGKATIIYHDNISSVDMSSRRVQHQCTKHVYINIYFMHNQVTRGLVRVFHVLSSAQYVVKLTKGLPMQLFNEFKSSLNVRNFPTDKKL